MSRARTLSRTRAQAGKRPDPKTPAATGPFLDGKKLNAVLCVLLAAATIALYSPVRGHPFFSVDDGDYVTANAHTQGGLAWSTIKWAFTSTFSGHWQPLTWLSHALDCQLFGLYPAGHHLDSVLIHALNAVLLFLLLGWVTKRMGPSLLVAALFAVHPINVESVAWVAARSNLLSTLFFFLTIAAYAWYVQKPGWRRYLLVAALFAVGLMAKPMVITLPFVLLLLDYWPLKRTPLDGIPSGPATSNGVQRVGFSRLLLEKIPLLFLPAASACITLKAQGYSFGGWHQFPLAVRIENAVVAYGLYLWKMLWPARLAALYPYPGIALPAWQWILSALVLMSVTALVVAFRGKRYLMVGWCWFLGTLIPVIGLVSVLPMADRYAYVPLIGIFVMIAWGLDDWAEAKAVGTVWRVIPALCVLAALGFATIRQLSYWDNDYDMWSHTVAVTEQNPFAHDALGSALIGPDSAKMVKNLKNLNTDGKRMDEARRHFERALDLRRHLAQQNPEAYVPEIATTLQNIGRLDRLQNRMNEATQHYEEALKILRQLAQQNPNRYLGNLAMALNDFVLLEATQGRMDEAHQHGEEALKIHRLLAERYPDACLPDLAMTLNNLGSVDRFQNRMDEARQHFEDALKIFRQLAEQNPDAYLPDVALTLNNLGKLDGVQNRMDDARQHFEDALKVYRQLAQLSQDKYAPDLAGTLENLGFLDRLQNRIEEARAHYQEALTLYRKLSQGDPSKYAGDVARVEAGLGGLEKKAPSR